MVAPVVNLRGRFFINRLTGKLDYVEDRTSTGSGDGYVHPLKHPASMIEEEQERSFMSYAEREKLQAIPEFWPADQVAEGEDRVFMYPSERAKLETIQEGANNFQLPSSLPASMIAEEQERSFMNYAEREKLQAIPEFWPADQVAEGEDRVFMYPSERAKLETIQEGANNFQLPASLPASMIAEEQERSFMSYAEREKLQAIPEFWPADEVAEGEDRVFMYPSERAKLETIQEGANNFQLPATLPASMIEESMNRNFLRDAERQKIATIGEGGAYQHPASHPAGMIQEETERAFVTWEQKGLISDMRLQAPLVRVTKGVSGVAGGGIDRLQIRADINNYERLEIWLFLYRNKTNKKAVADTSGHVNLKKAWVHPTDRSRGVTQIRPFVEYKHGNVPMQGDYVPLPGNPTRIPYRTTEFPLEEGRIWTDVCIDPCEFFLAVDRSTHTSYQIDRNFPTSRTNQAFVLKALGYETSKRAVDSWNAKGKSKRIFFKVALVRRDADGNPHIGNLSNTFSLHGQPSGSGFFSYHYTL